MEKENSEKKSRCVLDKQFVAYKAHYFLLNGAHVGVIPYLPVYAKSALGCSATTVGLLATCMQFSTTISKPLFGLLADCLNQMKILIATLLCLEVVLNLLMLALPPVDVTAMQEPHRQTPSYTSDILRFAPARVYDASIGLHSQPRMNVGQRAAVQRNFSEMQRTNKSRHYNESFPFSNNVTLMNVIHTMVPRHAVDTVKSGGDFVVCNLKCGSLIADATCYQSKKYCIDPLATSLLPCTLRRRSSASFCVGFEEKSNFSLAYEVANKSIDSSSLKKIKLRPHSFLYFRRFQKQWETFSCNVTAASCTLNCENELHACEQKQSSDKSLYETYQFWTFCLFALIGSMCQGAMYTLSDTVCYEKIRGTKTDYGRQRLWGAVGWGAIAPLTGFLNDVVTGKSIHEDYSSGWYIMAILSLFLLLNLFCMEFPQPKKSESMWKDVKESMTNRLFILMEVNVFFMGVLNAYAANYVIWYMESLGSSRMVMGLALAVECLFGEAPFMYFSGWFISKLGHWHIVTLTFAAFGARFGAYYFIDDPWLVLPVELLNGITFGLFYTTMTSFAENISPFGTEATIQGLLGGTHIGLGSGVGCLVAGISFDRYGGQMSFLLAGIFSICLALGHGILCLICKPHKKEVEKLEDTKA